MTVRIHERTTLTFDLFEYRYPFKVLEILDCNGDVRERRANES